MDEMKEKITSSKMGEIKGKTPAKEDKSTEKIQENMSNRSKIFKKIQRKR